MRKRDLVKAPNLKKTFTLINQHLYGRLKYTDTDTRTRSKEIVNLLLIKLVDEMTKSADDELDFCVKNSETDRELYERLQSFFTSKVKRKYPDLLSDKDFLSLNPELTKLIVQELQHISLLRSSKDVFADAFEVFVSKLLKEEGGQFFTPSNVVRFMVRYLNPNLTSLVLDPACGHGGFLLEVKDLLWEKINQAEVNAFEFGKKIVSNLYGIDKDAFLVKICKLYLEILSSGKSNIVCEDSLDPLNYRSQARELIKNEKFDVVLTNPPFGAKIPIEEKRILELYELGYQWKSFGKDSWKRSSILVKKKAPQILFIERCVQLLKNGGKLGIILPEGIFGNVSDGNIWEFLKSKGIVLGVVSLSQNTFQPYTCNKTSILFFQKLEKIPKDYEIQFAIVNHVGHDKDGKDLFKLNRDGSKKLDNDGKQIINDDLLELNEKMKKCERFNYHKKQLVFKINYSEIKNNIFIPYYYTGVEKKLKILQENKDYVLRSIKDLVKNKIIYSPKNNHLPRGDEIGSHVYGLGEVPFIRTSEISNWEINLDAHKKTSKEVYEQYKHKQNIEFGDLLLVKDGGPNLIGKTAFVTELDTNIIIQSHIFQLKCLENDDAIDPYLLIYLLNLDIVQQQIQAITFVQGTIATIGNRVMDVILPLPAQKEKRKEISTRVREIIEKKVEIRKKMKVLSLDLD
ncbi:MAG: N-6 DNA methylase [Candidatus Lokiarchaeota archaeon]|nr:N-6 DNA methylase [Candidatus Lokiarchaeota archaeon]